MRRSARHLCSTISFLIASIVVTREAIGQDAKPEYGKRQAKTFVIRVYHGTSVQAMSYQTATGGQRSYPPQPWVIEQGSQVCFEVVNAHPLKYTYVLGHIIDTTTPPDLKLPDLAGKIAETLGGTSVKLLQLRPPSRGPGKPRTTTERTSQIPPETQAPSIKWLETYTKKLSQLSDQLDEAKDIAKTSVNPEDLVHAEEVVPQRGLRWAKQQMLSIPSGKGDLASPTLEQTLIAWESDARREAAGARDAAKLEGESKVNWDAWTSDVISALSALGATTRSDWISLRDAYAKADPTWTSCATLGPHPIELTLSIKSTGATTARATGNSLLRVSVDPLYDWKLVESAPLAFAIYTPGAEVLSLADGRVERKDASFRFRAGAVLVTNLSAFDPRHEQSFGIMLGVGLLDASSSTAGKVDLLVGPIYRLRDILGIGLGLSLSERDKRKEQVIVGQPLPPDVPTIESAAQQHWLPGVVLAVSFKGYKF